MVRIDPYGKMTIKVRKRCDRQLERGREVRTETEEQQPISKTGCAYRHHTHLFPKVFGSDNQLLVIVTCGAGQYWAAKVDRKKCRHDRAAYERDRSGGLRKEVTL